MERQDVSPRADLDSFTCPHCGCHATQERWTLYSCVRPVAGTGPRPVCELAQGRKGSKARTNRNLVTVSLCPECRGACLWVDDTLVHPVTDEVPAPHADLPEDVRVDYEEAAAIRQVSPRGAAALLRLCIEKLCAHAELPGGTLSARIGALAKRGVPPTVQRALDLVRIAGNGAIHPGQSVTTDGISSLFGVVNYIAEMLIALPRRIDESYEAIPEGARQAIEKRDASE